MSKFFSFLEVCVLISVTENQFGLSFGHDFFLVTETSGNYPGIYISGIDLLNPSVLEFKRIPIVPTPLEPRAVDYDPPTSTIYWSEYGQNASINRYSLEDDKSEIFVPNAPWSVYCIIIDATGRKLYWVDASVDGKIEVINLDGTARTTLVTDIRLYDMGLDTVNGDFMGCETTFEFSGYYRVEPAWIGVNDCNMMYIYWADLSHEINMTVIERAKLDDLNTREVIVTDVIRPYIFTLSAEAQKMYWINHAEVERIEESDLDGSNRRVIANYNNTADPANLVIYGGNMYWPEYDGELYYAHIEAGSDSPNSITTGYRFTEPFRMTVMQRDECSSGKPCENGGTCQFDGSDFVCQCPPFYSGPHCEIEPGAWSQWYNCSQSCRQFRYRTCNQFPTFEGADCDGDSTEIRQMQDCPYTVETLEDFQKGTQFAKSAFQPVCYIEYGEHFDITYCFESYGSVQWENDVARFIHETIPVTFSIPDVSDILCSISLVWDFVYEEWIEHIKVQNNDGEDGIGLNGSSVSTSTRSGNYFQASKFLTISHEYQSYFPLVNLYFPPSAIKPEVTLLDDSCSQAPISETPICAYIDETHSVSTIGCETVANNFTYEGVECHCPLADAYVVILEALPALNLPKVETIVAVSGSGVNMASILIFFAQRIWNGMNVQTEGADIFNNILSSILLANGALLFDECVDYFRESSKQEILAQSLAYSLITLNVWMLFWIVDKSTKKQQENKNNHLGSFYQIIGWTVPIIYVLVSSCSVENYASYNYRHWPNIENGAIWTLFGPMAGLFLISLFVCYYKLHNIRKMSASDNEERWRIRRVRTSLVAYLVALVFLFGKWSMGIWTTDIPIFQFIFSLLLWTQFFAVACIYCVYHCCCKSSTTKRRSHKNNDKGRDNDNFDMKTEAAATCSHRVQNA